MRVNLVLGVFRPCQIWTSLRGGFSFFSEALLALVITVEFRNRAQSKNTNWLQISKKSFESAHDAFDASYINLDIFKDILFKGQNWALQDVLYIEAPLYVFSWILRVKRFKSWEGKHFLWGTIITRMSWPQKDESSRPRSEFLEEPFFRVLIRHAASHRASLWSSPKRILKDL